MAKRNLEKVKEFCKEVREDCIVMFKKNLDIEDLLEQPEATMIVGKTLKIYDKAVDLAIDQARQIDEMAEILEASYKTIQKMEETINDLREEVNRVH